MKFYQIKKSLIICLNAVRTASLYENTIFITFTSGDTKSEQIVFSTETAAAEAFEKLCTKLGKL
jgi:hypothetical protein